MGRVSVDVLRRVQLFAELEEQELEQIGRLLKQRRFPAGETVIKEGSGGAAFYIIESGAATVTVGGRERNQLSGGDWFGEMALVDQGPRSASVTAETDLLCHGLTFWDFQPLVQGNAAIAWKLVQALVQRLRAAQSAA